MLASRSFPLSLSKKKVPMNTPVKSSKKPAGPGAAVYAASPGDFQAVLLQAPGAECVPLSFFQWNMISPDMKYVGGQNYQEIFASTEFAKILGNTFTLAGFLLIFNFLLPYVFFLRLAYLVQNES